jgi:non-canonical (house-cleaning) NTP pyrophosphatase
MDEFSGQNDVRSNQGAFGLLTRNLITRDDSFYYAVINAMVPFLNKQYYKFLND